MICWRSRALADPSHRADADRVAREIAIERADDADAWRRARTAIAPDSVRRHG